MNEETLFHQALGKPPGERAAFLDEACAGDRELQAAVEALLLAHEASGPFLDSSADATIDRDAGQPGAEATGMHTPRPDGDPAPIPTTAEYRDQPAPDVRIAGRYTLQEKIGEGGMGEVWFARQSEPVKRKVALKLIKPGMDSRAVLQRFEQERQALAMMDHPNIARVLDAGLTPDGRPFFAMELVNGLPLNKFCDEARLKTNERLELFATICQAVQHAHQKGIVHRDLKPANILVTMIDARPVPKVIDFGVAKATAGKLTNESMSTQFGAVVGTLEYMSPEQAGFSGEDIDTRADIYSLGVILYELLTGLRPIDAARLKKAALTEMIRIIREEEPSKPSTRLSTDESLASTAALRQIEPRRLMALLRGDLDWVVMKCLEKQRDRRYETADALARDVGRYLDGDAVEACPPSVGYRMGKFLKRHKGPVLAASFVFLALVAGFIGTAWGLVRADRAWRAEASQRVRAEAREEMAIDAVKRFRDAVAKNPELKKNLTLEPLRKTLLKEPLKFFKALRDRLEADGDTRPESLDRLAHASFDLGDLTSEIGDKQDALVAYRESLAIEQKLADAYPANREFQRNLALSHDRLGVILRVTGKPAEALMAFETARAIEQKLADANPSDTRFRSDLASSHNGRGGVLVEIGRLGEAMKAYETALAIEQKLADANPSVTKFRSDLAGIHSSIGILWTAIGNRDKALEAFEAALAIEKELADANPTVSEFQIALSYTRTNIGRVLSEKGKPGEALKVYESVLATQQKLAAANPTVTRYQIDHAISLGNSASTLYKTGKPDEALKRQQSALEIWQKLGQANPTVTEIQNELANRHLEVGNMLAVMGKSAEALKAYEAGFPIRQKLARQHPESPDYVSSLGGQLNNMAMIEMDRGRYAVARDYLRQAVAYQKKALAVNPTSPGYRQFLTNHLNNLVAANRKLGDLAGLEEAENEIARHGESDPVIMALNARLPAIIRGEEQPRDNADRLQLAQRAQDSYLHATAARLRAEALAIDPKLGDDRRAQIRYNAACMAALAVKGVPAPAGRSVNPALQEPKPDDEAKAKLRKQAFDWLRGELSAWERHALIAEPGNEEAVATTLTRWKQNIDLAVIRDAQELAKLSEAERKEWQALWGDVETLLKRTQGTKP